MNILVNHINPATGTAQGWDLAVFHCGRCAVRVTASTEHEYIKRVDAHRARHELADLLAAKWHRFSGEQLDDDAAHRAADRLVQAVAAELTCERIPGKCCCATCTPDRPCYAHRDCHPPEGDG